MSAELVPQSPERQAIMQALQHGPIPFGMLAKVIYEHAEQSGDIIPAEPVYATTDAMCTDGILEFGNNKVGIKAQVAAKKLGAASTMQGGTTSFKLTDRRRRNPSAR